MALPADVNLNDINLKDWLQFLSGAGLTGALVLFIWGGMKKVWVWGYQLDDAKAREQGWKDEARRNADIAEQNRLMAQQALDAVRTMQEERRSRGRS